MNNSPSLDEFENDAALGGMPRRTIERTEETQVRQRSARQGQAQPRRRPTPDSTGPQTGRASSRERRPQRAPKPQYTFMDFLRDYRTHLGAGIFLCLVAVVMAGCTISFLFNSAADQSVIHAQTLQQAVESGEEVNNAF